MSDETNKNEDQDQDQELKAFEAALGSLCPRSILLPSPGTDAQRWSGRGAGVEGCVYPGSHRFICLYCGCDAPAIRGVRRIAWPAAFSAMTAAAAILLAMVVFHPKQPKNATDLGLDLAALNQPSDSTTYDFRPSQSSSLGGTETAYLTLRDQVLRYGVDSWKTPVSSPVPSTMPDDSPRSYREELKRLLQHNS
jgi:hypothetical protein